jgi:hypothetical protein
MTVKSIEGLDETRNVVAGECMAPCFRADLIRMNVIMGLTSRATINVNKEIVSPKKPLDQQNAARWQAQ